jgi:hypothetical protein
MLFIDLTLQGIDDFFVRKLLTRLMAQRILYPKSCPARTYLL